MAAPVKIRYEIALESAGPPLMIEGASVRTVSAADRSQLAELMLDAYVGTIDYDGESLQEAYDEVDSWFADGSPLTDHSYCAVVGGVIASAVLVSERQRSPFIGYVMTRASSKNQGLGRLVTRTALDSLTDVGYERVVLYITEGNAPSEALFRRLEAIPVPER